MGDKADMNKANEVRPIFRRLAEVAERTGCAVILIGHLNNCLLYTSIDRKERNTHPTDQTGRSYHDTEKRADHCCGAVF